MKKHGIWTLAVAFGLLMGVGLVPVYQAAEAQNSEDSGPPAVFQAAGPTANSIQSSVDAFREALGGSDNGNAPGPLEGGRREINWDGGGNNDTTTPPVTPFNVFLNIRGGQFTTPGEGLSQAPPSGGPQNGLVGLFNNPTYATAFRAFSPLRLFTPVGSNITDALFFIPGTNGSVPATVRGFGVVFTDVDGPNRVFPGGFPVLPRSSSTLIEYFDADDNPILSDFIPVFSGAAPASPGDGSFSFFGVIFDDARIARVRIITGDAPPGPNDDEETDIVMMDDFIYGEPQPRASQ